MSIQAIRGLILLLNLGLLGLIGWVCYGTFVTVDKEKYSVPAFNRKLYEVEPIQGNPDQENKKLYEPISRVLDRPPPPPPEKPKDVPPPPPLRADPRQMQVLVINFSRSDPSMSSALITAPLASPKDPKFVYPDRDLGDPQQSGTGLEAYKDVRITEIRENEVIVKDQKGAEIRLPGPRPGGGK